MMVDHILMGGRLHVYKRVNSRYWQCSTFLGGHNRRISTKEEGLSHAKDVAEDWYLELKGKHKRGEIKGGKDFRHAAKTFIREYEIITEGQRNAAYVRETGRRLENHLLPFFGDRVLLEITPGLVQEYRIHRREKAIEERGKPPARNTMHQEIVTLRHVLKTANRHGWLPYLPDLSEPYRASGKISHCAWFSPEEYKKLYSATRHRRRSPSGTATSGKARSFMTTCYSWPTRGSGRMKPLGLNTATSASSMTMPPARPFSKLRFVVNVVSVIARAPQVPYCRSAE